MRLKAQDTKNSGNSHPAAQNYGYDGYDPSVEMWDNWEDAVADESKIK